MDAEIIKRQAEYLAREYREAEPDMDGIYWFPDDDEVRLVEVHRDVAAAVENRLAPYYFRASPVDDLPARSAIALIRTDEFRRLELPKGWGDWDDAIEIGADS